MYQYLVYDNYHNQLRNRDGIYNPNTRPARYSYEWKLLKCEEQIENSNGGTGLLVHLYNLGIPIKKIMERFNLSSPDCIYVILQLYGIKPSRHKKRRDRRFTEEEEEKIKELYESGKSIYSIAKELGRPPSSVYYLLKRLGLR